MTFFGDHRAVPERQPAPSPAAAWGEDGAEQRAGQTRLDLRRGRRWLFAALAAAAVAGGTGVAWAVNRFEHGNPDPGGRILAGLTTVERAVPSDAQVMVRQENEPRWDSCDGRAGTFGWNDVTVNVQFRTSEQPEALIAWADNVLSTLGWQHTDTLDTPLGPGARWSRTLADSTVATATLGPGTNGGSVYWELGAVAPPRGQQASGC